MTLLLVVASWQYYSYLVEVDPGVSNALSRFESRHVRITSWGAVNVYAHVTSREHREDKRTTRPDTNIPRDVGRTSPSMWGSLRLAPISYKFKILNNKEKPPTTGKLNQWWKQRQLSTCMILNCTSLKKKKRTQTRKLKRFLSKSKGCRVVKSTTGPQCKLTRNKRGMVTRLTC